MKHLKAYENITEETPQINDYVIVDEQGYENNVEIQNFVNNNIGQIKKMKFEPTFFYLVYFNNLPDNIEPSKFYYSHYGNDDWEERNCRMFLPQEILSFGKTPEEAIVKLTSNKYNL